MTDRNYVRLEGVIVGDVTYKKTSAGKNYCSFTIRTETKGSEGFSTTNTYVFVFTQPRIDYLKRVGAREGNRVSVDAHLRTSKKDVHGATVMQTIVTVDDVHIIKMS